jgi:YVTN family beta-propeller protein
VGHVPADIAAGRESVWVTNHCDGTVSRIDPATDRVVRSIKLGYHPQWLALGRGFAWIGVGKGVYFGTCA